MSEKINKDLEILIAKKDCTRWMDISKKTLLPIEDYHFILTSQPFKPVEKITGFYEKLDIANSIYLYYAENPEIAIAQVCSRSINDEVQGKHLTNNHDFSATISISTYTVWENNIIVLNRFDAQGREHQNHFHFLNGTRKSLSQKYFKNQSFPPHFHFNTKSQSEHLKNASRANAISIPNLIEYLEDLQNETDLNNNLLKDNLGMPFLNFRLGKSEYNSRCFDIIKKFVSGRNIDNDIQHFMASLIFYYNKPSTQGIIKNNNLNKLILDLKTINLICNMFPNESMLIETISKEILTSVSGCQIVRNTTTASEDCSEEENENE